MFEEMSGRLPGIWIGYFYSATADSPPAAAVVSRAPFFFCLILALCPFLSLSLSFLCSTLASLMFQPSTIATGAHLVFPQVFPSLNQPPRRSPRSRCSRGQRAS